MGRKIMSNIPIGTTWKLFCNTCKRETYHAVKAAHMREENVFDDEEEGPPIFWESWEYRFWVCKGCDTALLQESYTDASMYNPDTEKYIESSTFFPQRTYRVRPQKRFRNLGEKLETIYKEVIIGFNAGVKIGCSISIRALVEGICVNKGITDEIAWGLEKKLKKLEEGNHVPPNIVDGLLSLKFIGDDAAHKLEAPSKSELQLAIDVIEDLLNFLYEMEYQLAIKVKKLAENREVDLANLKDKRAKDNKAKKDDTAKRDL
jgi:hypothetical protein